MNSMTLEQRLKFYRLNQAEFATIKTLLGREMREIEWPIFSSLWSEHCSYKSSKIHLRKFAETLGSQVVAGVGENAGVVDLGQDERVAFKMESHNHPSFIEPYQGAATGVGGILRDIFTMGARPIAIADYLCFGEPGAEKMKSLVDGVVRGISGYGNSVGVPTVTGQTQFDSSYNRNILVNAMAVGLMRKGEELALSKAHGAGNFVVYVGAKTGKDGVHGAAMASESFSENSEAKKPNVQIGDPFFEKLLIESCLEVIQKNLVEAIQDMGAAGITSSSFEMASKGQVGLILNLDQVPLRDSSMSPEEILLSESQERMLLVCRPEQFSLIQKVFHRWGLDATQIGVVQKERRVDLFWHGECLTQIDPDLVVENAPVYERPFQIWKAKHKVAAKADLKVSVQSESVKNYFSGVHGASRLPIYRQYDQRVGANTVRGAEHDVAILHLPDSERGLLINVGCRSHVMKMDAQLGAFDSVLYPAFQMAIKGGKAVALTDCLNFGNPEKSEIMSEFVASVEAIRDACLALKIPVVSGNVSFYNETMGQGITPTPATGLVGLRAHVKNIPEDQFQCVDSSVYLLEETQVWSEGLFQQLAKGSSHFFGQFDLKVMAATLEKWARVADFSGVKSTQMLGRGGLGVGVCEMAKAFGFKMTQVLNTEELFLERFYACLIEVEAKEVSRFEEFCKEINLSPKKIGIVTALEQIFLNSQLQFGKKELRDMSQTGLRRSIENLA